MVVIAVLFLALPSSAQMTIGDMKVGQGVTSPSDWVDYDITGAGFDFDGIYVDVNTSACGFTETPHYLVTLESVDKGPRAGSGKWETSGYTAIYSATPEGFRVLARWTDGNLNRSNYTRSLTAEQAERFGYVIRWTAISTGECSRCGEMNPDPNAPENGVDDEPVDSTATGIQQVDVPLGELQLYPNPAGTILNLKSPVRVLGVKLFGANGQLIRQYAARTEQLDISSLPAGTYVVTVALKDSMTVTKQFVKQ